MECCPEPHHSRTPLLQYSVSIQHGGYLRRHLFSGWPRRGQGEGGGFIDPGAGFGFDLLQFLPAHRFSDLEHAREARDGILLLPGRQPRKLAILRRITFIVAAHALGQAFDERRTAAAPASGGRPGHRLAHGDEIVAVHSSRGNAVSASVLRQALGQALTGMLRDGEITRPRAQELARMVMRENALKLYHLR